MTEVAQL